MSMGPGPALLDNLFIINDNVNKRTLRSNNDLFLPQVNTVHYGHDSLRYFGCKIWEIIPHEIKSSINVEQFKSKIKLWVPSECPCRLCKTYLYITGYVDLY